jgi:hypothetical protein
MLIRLSIRLSPDATPAALQDTFHQQREMEWVGQTELRGRNTLVVYVISKDARPVNWFCRRLIEGQLAETVTVQRLDV